jgi:hypothetical protein
MKVGGTIESSDEEDGFGNPFDIKGKDMASRTS